MNEQHCTRIEESQRDMDRRLTRLEANEPHFMRTLDEISTSLKDIGEALQKHMSEEASVKWRIALAIGGGMGTVILILASVVWAHKATIIG